MANRFPSAGDSVGAGFQVFEQSNGISGVYADAAARDSYFSVNPSEVDRVAENEFLIIKLLDDGGGMIAYQQYLGTAGQPYDNSQWSDVTSLVQGETGAPGAPGNSFFFNSIAERDTFFSTSPNETLLKTDLPVIVNTGNKVATTFVWEGPNAPPLYDPDNWRTASIGASSGTIFLGESAAQLNSGNEVIGFITPSGTQRYLIGVEYDNVSGSDHPFYWEMATAVTTPLGDVFTDTLASPNEILGTQVTDALISAIVVRPAASGDLRVQGWLGTNDSGPVLYDEDYTIAPGDVGNLTTLQLVNDFINLTGQQLFLRFSGVDLLGGVQTTGPYVGQNVIYLEITTQDLSLSKLLTLEPGAPNPVNGIPYTTNFSNPQFRMSSNLTFDDNGTDATLMLQSPPGGIAFLEVENSSDVLQAAIGYSETFDEASMSLKGMSLTAGATANTFQINTNDLNIVANTGNIIITNDTDSNTDVSIANAAATAEATFSIEDSSGTDKVIAGYDETIGTSQLQVGSLQINSADAGFTTFSQDDAFTINTSSFGISSVTMSSLASAITFIDSSGPTTRMQIIHPQGSDTSFIQDMGGNLELQRGLLLEEDGTNFTATITNPGAVGTSAISIVDSSSSAAASLYLDQSAGEVRLDIDNYPFTFRQLKSTEDLTFSTVGGGKTVLTHGGSGAQPVVNLESTGVNGANIELYMFGGPTPVGNIFAAQGNFAFTNTLSDNDNYLWVKQTGSALDATGWVRFLTTDDITGGGGDVTGPASSVDTALPYFDGVTGKLLGSNNFIRHDTPLDIALMFMYSPNASGATHFDFVESNEATTMMGLRANEVSQEVSLFTAALYDFVTNVGVNYSLATATGSVTLTAATTFDATSTGAMSLDGSSLDISSTGGAVDISSNTTGSFSTTGELVLSSSTGVVDIISGTNSDVVINTMSATSDVTVKGWAIFTEDSNVDSVLELQSQVGGTRSALRIRDNTNVEAGGLNFEESDNGITVEALLGAVNLSSSAGAVNITSDTAGIDVGYATTLEITSAASENTEFMNVSQQAADISYYATTTATPNGSLSGDPGDVVFHSSGTNSSVFVNRGASAGNTQWADTTAGSVLYWGDAGITATTTTRYLTPGWDAGNAPTAPISFVLPRDGFMRNMHIYHNVPGTSPNQILYSTRINNVDTPLSVAIASNGTTNSNTSVVIPVSAGDLIDIEVVKPVATDTNLEDIMCTIEFV